MKVKYSHEWLENCKLIGYLVKKQIAKKQGAKRRFIR